jgi:hypothetical protein
MNATQETRIVVFALLLILTGTLRAQSPADTLPMNEIQVLGSHNSYKQPIDPPLMKLLLEKDSSAYSSLEYSHIPLAEQLDLGLRKLELDVVYDPKGGVYAKPLGLSLIKGAAVYDPHGEMTKPGFKVIHIPDIDFRSHIYTLRQALVQLRAWSDAHPNHLPIAITMNAKDIGAEVSNAVKPLRFDRAASMRGMPKSERCCRRRSY